ncbi:MAG TPA: hypothetical protein PKN48_10990 [Bacteroidales bacterium]|nr:hypothetical protein [Bacteroidales bacterium]
MKTPTLSLRKSALSLFAFRFALVIGFLVFTTFIGKSQTDRTIATKDPSLVKPVENNQTVVHPPVQNPNDDVIYKNIGAHAPDINDPDFRTKSEEWMKNYPEEFDAWMLRTVKAYPGTSSENYPEFAQPKPAIQKVAEHAPAMNDPDYQAKKLEWMKNYPEEYDALMKKSLSSQTGQNTGKTPIVKHPAASFQQKVAEHAPLMSDPDYEAKKLEWMKNYPEEYNALLEKPSSTQEVQLPSLNNTIIINDARENERMEALPEVNVPKSNTGSNTGVPGVVKKPSYKVAEHAPYLDDPDYAAKKEEWIKNYPEEYERVVNSTNVQPAK